jgi:hypothetical protein
MKSPRSLAALVVLAGLGACDSVSAAGSLHWLAPVADCYDTGVSQKRAVVIIFFDPVSTRLDADKMSMRLSMSPRMQALSDVTVWCMGDVTRDLVAKNMAKALGISEYPTLSVLAPNPSMLDETGRIVGFRGPFAENGLEGAQNHIIRGVAKVQAAQAKDGKPGAATLSKR